MATNTISVKLHLLSTLCFTALGAGVALLAAGPLTPPSGAVTSTNKTLSEVEPRIAINSTNTAGDANSRFRIAAPGSYYLTGNISVLTAESAIEIAASNVTIDLNGYALTSGIPTSLDGITTDGLRDNITIRNGTITGYGSDGINLTTGGSGTGARIEKVTATANGAAGIRAGLRSVVRNCTTLSNGTDGVNVLTGSMITECVSAQNARGFAASTGSVMSACSAYNNSGDGFSLSGYGTITQCSATSNTGRGYFLGIGGMISSCVAGLNGDHGIQLNANCTAKDNACGNNASAGIYATGDTNRIESNNCVANSIGIHLPTGNRSTITGNTCSGSTGGDTEIRVVFNPVGPGASAVIHRNFAEKRGNITPYDVNPAFTAPLANIGGGGWLLNAQNSAHPWANFEN